MLGVRAAQRSIGALPPCWPPVPDGEPMALWPESAAEALSFLPLLCVLFVCHFNVLGAHAALSTPTWARATASVDLAVLASSALYVAFGLSGFALARASTPGDILTALPVDDPAAALARGLLLLTLLAACPIACVPCRAALWRLLRLGFLPSAPAAVDERAALLLRRAPCLAEDEPGPRLRWAVTALILAAAFALVTVVGEGVEKVWGLAGASVCIAISFLLPTSFYLRLVAPESTAARALLAITSVIAVVCTVQNLARMVAAPEPAA